MFVANLKENAFDGHTWKEIRDALKSSLKLYDEMYIAYTHDVLVELKMKNLKALMSDEGSERNKKEIKEHLYHFIHKSDDDPEFKEAKESLRRCYHRVEGLPDQIADMFKRKQELIDFLAQEDLIERLDNPQNYRSGAWEVTEKGAALCRQKAVSQLARKPAINKLKKVIEAVKAHNADPDESFYVDKVMLFGSLLKGSDKVSDIDLSFSIQRRYHDLDTEEWWQREKQRIVAKTPGAAHKWNFYYMTTSENVMKKIRKMGAHISATSDYDSLSQWLDEEDQPHTLVFEGQDILNPEHERKSVDLNEEQVFQFLERGGLVSSQSTPEKEGVSLHQAKVNPTFVKNAKQQSDKDTKCAQNNGLDV